MNKDARITALETKLADAERQRAAWEAIARDVTRDLRAARADLAQARAWLEAALADGLRECEWLRDQVYRRDAYAGDAARAMEEAAKTIAYEARHLRAVPRYCDMPRRPRAA
jgi:hypothetical protein